MWDLDTPDMPYSQDEVGWFSSRIPILSVDGVDEVLSIYALDSTSTKCMHAQLPGSSCTSTTTVEWLEIQQMVQGHDFKLRDFIFIHHPLQEFMHLANLYNHMGHKHQIINCQTLNTGLYAQAVESVKTAWISAGADADNDFAGRYHDTFFSYARKSGYDDIGTLPRGARVFELEFKRGTGMKGSSYVLDGETLERNIDMEK